jgi:hypothetical protein
LEGAKNSVDANEDGWDGRGNEATSDVVGSYASKFVVRAVQTVSTPAEHSYPTGDVSAAEVEEFRM